jgi:hypothetical protein
MSITGSWDTDGDGAIDTTAADFDGDGVTDVWTSDVDEDGYLDQAWVDTNNDGAADTALYLSQPDTYMGPGMVHPAPGATGNGSMSGADPGVIGGIPPSSGYTTIGGTPTSTGTGVVGGSAWTAGPSMSGSGTSDPYTTDSDYDGTPDAYDPQPSVAYGDHHSDTDGDGIPDPFDSAPGWKSEA